MQSAIVFLTVVAAATAGGVVSSLPYFAGTSLTRTPRYDSAVIKSDRLGGNFAYSVAESHAYSHNTPIIQHVTSPVGVSYSAGAPVVTGYNGYAAGPIVGYNGYNGYNFGYAAPAYRAY